MRQTVIIGLYDIKPFLFSAFITHKISCSYCYRVMWSFNYKNSRKMSSQLMNARNRELCYYYWVNLSLWILSCTYKGIMTGIITHRDKSFMFLVTETSETSLIRNGNKNTYFLVCIIYDLLLVTCMKWNEWSV